VAEKKVLEEVCPCAAYRAEVFVDVESKSARLDFVEVEEPKKKKEKPAESESTIIGRVLLGE